MHPQAWLLSAYHTDSHARWADWLINNTEGLDWSLFSLPGRHFRWRIRGNPLSWLDTLPAKRPALLVATSMVDLATLRGLRIDLARVPTLYYFHENQFAYPRSDAQHRSVDPQMVQLYGALSAQQVLFNSRYNQDSFFQGARQLLSRLPDHLPVGLIERIQAKAGVLAVPVAALHAAPGNPRLIAWNHRWEYDKAPEVFVAAIARLAEHNVPFQLALLGSRPAHGHPGLQQLQDLAGDRILCNARLPRQDYLEVIAQAAIVVSSAIHEFQGLAMLEAVSAGARPLVPDALCYPEQYPDEYRYPAGNSEALADKLTTWLQGELPPALDVSDWHEQALLPLWQKQLDSLLESEHG